MKKLIALVGVAAVCGISAMGLSNSVTAAGGVKVGSLGCDVSGGIGLILGSKKSVRCTYQRASDGREEYYTGSIGKFGLDIGVTTSQHMVWAVFSPGQVGAGSLAGTYVGATAEATVGAGVGANVLIGGFNKTITLQPLSVTGQTGLNVAGGVASLSLRSD